MNDPADLPWLELENNRARHGSWRRIHPESRQDLRLQVSPAARRRLVLGLPAGHAFEDGVENTGGVAVFTEPDGGGLNLVVELRDAQLAPVFNGLVTDIADYVAEQETPDEAAQALSVRFGSWVNLLRQLAAGGLGTPERRGLFGELAVLTDLIGTIGQLPAVEAWTGPTRANQDFQLLTLAIEVKTTTAKNPQTILIASERELDDTGVETLLLARLSIDERRGGDGESLNSHVNAVRGLLSDPGASALFDTRLAATGYLPGPQYDEPRYSIRRRDDWHVRGEFPRIVEQDLRDGVGDVTYGIVTAGLAGYETDLNQHLRPSPEA